MDWVQRNIGVFNGDPKRVTIFGESSGGGSVDALLTSPPNPVPFHAAIIQSNEKTVSPHSIESASSWARLVNATNCPHDDAAAALECIRGKPVLRLKEIIERAALPFNSITDGITLSKSPRQNRLKSKENPSLIARVPVMVGNNANEGSMYVIGQNSTEIFLKQIVSVLYPNGAPEDLVKKVLDAYPLGEKSTMTETDRMDRILTEVLSQCPIKVVADDSIAAGISAWRYYYDASFPNTEIFPGSGAYHSAEIKTIFGTFDRVSATSGQLEVSKRMQKAWVDFAKNPSQGPGWDMAPKIGVFGGGMRAGQHSEATPVFEVRDKDLDKRCILWQSLWKTDIASN